MNLDIICEQVTEITITTGLLIKRGMQSFKSSSMQKKGLHNFVTQADKDSEKRIIRGLEKILPQAGFIAEEGTSKKKGDKYNWIIDPLDGTTNFIHRMSPFAISVALLENNKIILGVVYEIGLNECFYAHIDSKAFLNRKEIQVSNVGTVFDSLIATGFPYTDFSRMKNYFKTMDYFMRNSHGLRRLGSAATDLAYVACGRCDAFYEYGLNPWDLAAGAILVKQAGGIVTDFTKGTNYLYGREIIATNNKIHDEFYKIISKFMNED